MAGIATVEVWDKQHEPIDYLTSVDCGHCRDITSSPDATDTAYLFSTSVSHRVLTRAITRKGIRRYYSRGVWTHRHTQKLWIIYCAIYTRTVRAAIKYYESAYHFINQTTRKYTNIRVNSTDVHLSRDKVGDGMDRALASRLLQRTVTGHGLGDMTNISKCCLRASPPLRGAVWRQHRSTAHTRAD